MFVPYGDINPRRRTPIINYALIAANVLVFFFLTAPLSYKAQLILNYKYGLIPDGIKYESFLTSLFLHADMFHLFGNMLYLWIMGDNIEDTLGHFFYPIFYLAGGIAAGAVHIMSVSGEVASIPCIGASGAISAVTGAYLVLFPNSRIKFFYFIMWFWWGTVAIPAVFAIGLWFVLQLVSASFTEDSGVGIAYWAHIGGFIFGVVLAFLLVKLGFCKQKRYQYE
ncbi:MAG: rhomboid family intramembrane serine protease [Planctomycetes bacterium]|nr:rhomboid family intramembrane serine protease [Planctomycetota bacterium]